MTGWIGEAVVGLAAASAGLVGVPARPRPPARLWRLRAEPDRGRGARGPVSGSSARSRVVAGWRRWCAWSGGRLLRLRPGGRWGPVAATAAPVPGRSGAGGPVTGHEAAAVRLGAAVTVGLGAAVVSPLLALPVAVVVWVAPAWRSRRRLARRQRQLIEVMPDLVEMFRLASGAGLSVHLSVRALAGRVDGPGGEALAEVVAGQDRGGRLADGLESLGSRGEPLRPLASALLAAERYGAALGPALDRASVEAREVRRRRAEESARRLPVLTLFPLVLCILPAGALLTVVPLLAASWPRLGG